MIYDAIFDDSDDLEDEEQVQVPVDEGRRPIDSTDVAPQWLPLLQQPSGPKANIQDPGPLTPASVYSCFITDEMVDVVVVERNRYAEKRLQALSDRNPSSRLRKWNPTDRNEMKVFFVLLIAMGIIHVPKVDCHWTSDWLFATPGFPKIMSCNKFQLLVGCLHFTSDEDAIRDDHGRHVDSLFKLRIFITKLTSAFRDLYYPGKWVSIDEQMVAFKGRLHFKQYQPKKPTKWGINAFVLAESSTGYVYK